MLVGPATVALNRFGLGARPGVAALVLYNAKVAIAAELDPEVALLDDQGLLTTAAALTALRGLQMERKQARQMHAVDGVASNARGSVPAGPDTPEMNVGADALTPASVYRAEIAARLNRAGQVKFGYVERLVAFWSNHFAIKAGADEIDRILAGAFEREAIRPHVLGRFADMLVAVTQHPAMLAYLNNETSIGPDSVAGQRRQRGLNENHARELMELHTVGVDGGYSQADVTSVADILSGWSFARGGDDKNPVGNFVLRANAHEPGPRAVMGKVYNQPGEQQGLALLADLASSRATAHHIAFKLCQSFVADQPPPALVDRLAETFRSSDGDLLQMSQSLVASDEAWEDPGRFRTPQQFIWASVRALAIQPKPELISHALGTLGQLPWDPPSPAGYDETAATWLAPDAMTTRLDVAEQLAQLADPTTDLAELLDDLFGGAASAKTRETVARAESQHQGLALLLMSPEFQRI